MNKCYNPINWQNEKEGGTTLDASNLNKIDVALNEIDNRAVELDSAKANQADLLAIQKEVSDQKQSIGTLESDVGGLKTKIDNTDAEVAALKTASDTSIEDISNLKTKTDKTNEAVTAQGKVLKQTVEALDNRIKKFYTNNLGENHIADSDDGVFRNIRIEGNSEQVTTTGAQLIVPVSKKTMNIASVAVTYEDGIVTLNGTATGTTTLALVTIQGGFLPSLEASTTYCLSTEPRNTYEQGKTYAQYWSNVVGVEGQTKNAGYGVFTTGANEVGETDANIGIYVEEGVTYNNYSFSVQFEKASAPSPHEPYTGGQPSPNPNYTQDMNSVENATVEVNGSNLLDLSGAIGTTGTNSGITCTVMEDGSYDYVGTAENVDVNVWIKGSYTNTEPVLVIPAGRYYISGVNLYYNRNNVFLEKNGNYITFATDTVIGGIRAKSAVVGQSYNETVYPIIARVQSDTPVPWTPYVPEQLAPIPVTLRSVGEGENAVRDVMYVYADGTGKLVQKIYTVASPTVKNIDSLGKIGMLLLNNPPLSHDSTGLKPNILCTCFMAESLVIARTLEFAITQYGDGIGIRVGSIEQTVNAYNEWIAFNPFMVQYPLETPIETALTAEQVKALFDLRTHYGGTHISFESENGVEPTINFDYACSLENFVEYVKQQQNDDRKIIYNMDDRLTDSEYMSALAYVNSEYATVLLEMGV